MRTCIPAVVEVVNSSLRFSFPFISSIDIADQMVAYVIAHLRKKCEKKVMEIKREGRHSRVIRVDGRTWSARYMQR
jgi:hypothetical protein